MINKTLRGIELFFVNNGSIDNSPDIPPGKFCEVNRIVSIHRKNVGTGTAKNKGTKLRNMSLCLNIYDEIRANI